MILYRLLGRTMRDWRAPINAHSAEPSLLDGHPGAGVLERALALVRAAGILLLVGVGSIVSSQALPFVILLGVTIALLGVVVERGMRQLRTEAERVRRSWLVVLSDVLTFLAAFLVFAPLPEDYVHAYGPLAIITNAYRLGARGAAATSALLSAAFAVAQIARTQQYGYAFDALEVLAVTSAYVFIAIVVSGVLRELAVLRDRLERSALYDLLTGLPNRRLLNDRLEHALRAARRTSGRLSLLVIDMDRFKEINDTQGHPAGDRVLAEIAARLRTVLRDSDTVARLSGDEFAMVLPGADESGAVLAADRVLACLEPLFAIDDRAVRASTSIGMATFPRDAATAEGLLQCADVAMYEAKRQRARRVAYSSALIEDRRREERELADIRAALERDEFVLHYQPKVDARSLRATGVEALVRWQHPERGLLAPGAFLPLLKANGLGGTLDLWVLRRALEECRAWWTMGIELTVAVNVGMDFAQDAALPRTLEHLLTAMEMPARCLEIEITEDATMTDPAAVEVNLRELAARGIRASIDDFGTGRSSLGYLQRLSVHALKIDRSFVQRMLTSAADMIIVRSTISLGHDLGLRVIAEGVEDTDTWERLRELDCDLGQGYGLGRPQTLCDLLKWLAESPLGTGAPEFAIARARVMSLLALADRSEATRGWAGEGDALERLERERASIGIALAWARSNGEADLALRLASALRFYCIARAHQSDGIAWIEGALATSGGRAQAVAAAWNALGVLRGEVGEHAGARAALERAAEIQRAEGDRAGLARTLANLGVVADLAGDRTLSTAYLEESLELRRACGDEHGVAISLNNLAIEAFHRRDRESARRFAAEALEIHERCGDHWGAADALETLGALALEGGDLEQARDRYARSVTFLAELGIEAQMAAPLSGLALVAARAGQPLVALKLAGAVAARRAPAGAQPALVAEQFDQLITRLSTEVRDHAVVMAEGRTLSASEAATLVRALPADSLRAGRSGAAGDVQARRAPRRGIDAELGARLSREGAEHAGSLTTDCSGLPANL